jgi:hypothetical protein
MIALYVRSNKADVKTFMTNLFLAGLAVLAPIKAILITVGILIFADLLTGMWAAVKRKEPISSAAMRRTVSKMLVYHLCIISGFLVETFLLAEIIPVTKLIAGVIGLIELKSLLENANIILGKDLFKEVLARLGSKNDQR